MRVAPTPLISIHVGVSAVSVFAKLESRGPTGSIKDRTARSMIDAAESDGRLLPGDVIVEASSGNTGIAIAALGAERGYDVNICLLYTSPSPRDRQKSRMPSSA